MLYDHSFACTRVELEANVSARSGIEVADTPQAAGDYAVTILNRVKDKLVGQDFLKEDQEPRRLDVHTQVWLISRTLIVVLHRLWRISSG